VNPPGSLQNPLFQSSWIYVLTVTIFKGYPVKMKKNAAEGYFW
jgi:hypothetical protein